MSSLAQAHPGNPRSNEVMPGLSARAQALLAPRHHPQFTRAVPMPDAALCWPGTWIKRSVDNGFTRPAGPSVMAKALPYYEHNLQKTKEADARKAAGPKRATRITF
jgi:hypothetical protein